MPGLGADPEAFIRHHLLTLHSDLDHPAQALLSPVGTVRVTLVDITNEYEGVWRNRNRRGLARLMPSCNTNWWVRTAQLFQVTPAQPGDAASFHAYICPYKDNRFKAKFLDSAADVMFTGDMDGCSFGVGMANAQGGVRVGHVNAKDSATGDQFHPNYTQQRADQANRLATENLTRGMVDPDRYRDGAPAGGEFKAVTIGLRINRAWRFYYQHHSTDGPGPDGHRQKMATVRIA